MMHEPVIRFFTFFTHFLGNLAIFLRLTPYEFDQIAQKMGTLFYVLKMCVRCASWLPHVHFFDWSPHESASRCFLCFLCFRKKEEAEEAEEAPTCTHIWAGSTKVHME